MNVDPMEATAAVRAMFEDKIPKSFADFERMGNHPARIAHSAAHLVMEQVNGPRNPWTGFIREEPCSFREAWDLVEQTMPELRREHWETETFPHVCTAGCDEECGVIL